MPTQDDKIMGALGQITLLWLMLGIIQPHYVSHRERDEQVAQPFFANRRH